MKNIYKLTMTIMFTLLFSVLGFSQDTRERVVPEVQPNNDIIVSVNNVQSVSENVIIFGSKLVKADKSSSELVAVANCLQNKVTIVVFIVDGMAYRINQQLQTPAKDSPLEVAVISACRQKPTIKEEIN